MSDIETLPADPRTVKLVYALFLLGLFFSPVILAGLVIAYTQRSHVSEGVLSHYRFQIRTVWISLLYTMVFTFPAFFVFGSAVMGMASPSTFVLALSGLVIIAVLAWWVIRCVRGLLLASKGTAIPNPESWLFGG